MTHGYAEPNTDLARRPPLSELYEEISERAPLRSRRDVQDIKTRQ
jgi:hypothetical protein